VGRWSFGTGWSPDPGMWGSVIGVGVRAREPTYRGRLGPAGEVLVHGCLGDIPKWGVDGCLIKRIFL
jgi:hypothetical protein